MYAARNKKKCQNITSKKLLSLRGYTVIEILIVVIIMFILFGVGTAGYRGFQRRKELDGAANKIKADLRLAQEMAMSGIGKDKCALGETMVAVVFSVSSPAYTINTGCSDGTNTNIYPVSTYDLSTYYPNITVGSTGDVIFNILGRGVENDETVTVNHSQITDKRDVNVTTGGEINITN